MANVNLKTRINKYDNLKGLVMIFVVFAHMVIINNYGNYFAEFNLIRRFFFVIVPPIFFFVAGYFTKLGPDYYIKSTKRILIPYLIFCVLYKVFIILIGQDDGRILFINPSYGLWFLITLFTLKLLLPVFDKFKYPVIVSLIIAALFGFFQFDGVLLGLTRTFAYLPAFLIGFKYKDYKKIFSDKRPKLAKILDSKKVLLVLFIISTIICIALSYRFPYQILQMLANYKYDLSFVKVMLKKVAVILIGLAFTILLTELMTNKNTFLSKVGRNCMAVYILHLPVHYLIKYIYNYPIFDNELTIFVVAIALTTILVYVLSRDVVTKYFNIFTMSIANFIERVLLKPEA